MAMTILLHSALNYNVIEHHRANRGGRKLIQTKKSIGCTRSNALSGFSDLKYSLYVFLLLEYTINLFNVKIRTIQVKRKPSAYFFIFELTQLRGRRFRSEGRGTRSRPLP